MTHRLHAISLVRMGPRMSYRTLLNFEDLYFVADDLLSRVIKWSALRHHLRWVGSAGQTQ